MPRFVTAADTKEIRAPWWDTDETVTIKKLTYGDRQTIQKASARMSVTAEGSFDEIALGDVNLVIMEVGVVSWTFVRPETGKPVPCTRRWFERLTEEDGDFILAEINAFNPPPRRTEAEVDEFRDAGGDGDSAE